MWHAHLEKTHILQSLEESSMTGQVDSESTLLKSYIFLLTCLILLLLNVSRPLKSPVATVQLPILHALRSRGGMHTHFSYCVFLNFLGLWGNPSLFNNFSRWMLSTLGSLSVFSHSIFSIFCSLITICIMESTVYPYTAYSCTFFPFSLTQTLPTEKSIHFVQVAVTTDTICYCMFFFL